MATRGSRSGAGSSRSTVAEQKSGWYEKHLQEAMGRLRLSWDDSEAVALALWEEVASARPDPKKLGELASQCLEMPWNQHLAKPLANHGFDAKSRNFPRGVRKGLLRFLQDTGMGANPMPFGSPRIEACELVLKQTVVTARGEHVLDQVLTRGTSGYGFVRNLQNCIYGKVKHGIELASEDGRWRATGRQVAIKCIERTKYEAHVARHRGRLNEDPIKEVAVMQHVESNGGARNVLGTLGCFGDDNTVFVVMPFCPHGDLFGLIERKGALPEPAAVVYFHQIVGGLERLHSLGLAHHDMSLENLMLDDDRAAVVIDFGMTVKTGVSSRNFLAPVVPASTPTTGDEYYAVPLRPSTGWPCRCGKLLYMAPELFEPARPFDVFAADVWALGIILFLLLTGMPPWDAARGPSSNDMRYVYIRDGKLKDLLDAWHIELSKDAPDLLQRLLDANPRTRITIPQIKRHVWWRTPPDARLARAASG